VPRGGGRTKKIVVVVYFGSMLLFLVEIESHDGYAGYGASPVKKPRAGSFSCGSSSATDSLHSPYHPLLHRYG